MAKIANFFWILSGDDKNIIKECDKEVKNRFITIGLFVFLIFILCFISSYAAFTMFFNSAYVGISISIFFAFTITNIYLLILYTLSKNSFHDTGNNRLSRFISLFIRVGFIVFIAIVVSKPMEVLLYSKLLKNDIENYKKEQVKEYEHLTKSYYQQEVEEIRAILENTNSINNSYYVKLLRENEVEKNKAIDNMKQLISNSSYYTQSIIFLNSKHPSCWLITIFIVLIFLMPASQKRYIREKDISTKFYDKKRELERWLVLREYEYFKKNYVKIFRENFDKKIEFHEEYLDPPFNTQRKDKAITYLDNEDLIKDLYA